MTCSWTPTPPMAAPAATAGERPAMKKYQFTQAMPASPARITSQSGPLIIVPSSSGGPWSGRGGRCVSCVADGLGDLRRRRELRVVCDRGSADGDVLDPDAIEALERLLHAGHAVAAAHAVDLEGGAGHGSVSSWVQAARGG